MIGDTFARMNTIRMDPKEIDGTMVFFDLKEDGQIKEIIEDNAKGKK